MINNTSFWERVKTSLKNQKRTQKEMCEALNIPLASHNNRVSKNLLPSADMLLDIAQYLGVSMEYLLTGQEQPVIQDTIKKGQVISALETALTLLKE